MAGPVQVYQCPLDGNYWPIKSTTLLHYILELLQFFGYFHVTYSFTPLKN